MAGVGEGRWAVVPLSSAQRVEQARGAITRVVKAGQLVRGARAGQLRAALIGRMLAQVPEDFVRFLRIYVEILKRGFYCRASNCCPMFGSEDLDAVGN